MYLHSGVGKVNLDGIDWLGVTDPIGGRLLGLGTVEEPRFGQAAALSFVLSGVNQAFLKSVYEARGDLEGRPAYVWWAAFNAETQKILIPRKLVFPRGRITSPKLTWQGIGVRTVTLTIESIFSAQNFAPGGRWNAEDQKRRHPGDRGLEFVGVNVVENWQ